MSINLNDFQEVPFRDVPPSYMAIKNCTPPKNLPGGVPVNINWSNYTPPGVIPVAVRIPLNINFGVRTPLDKIVSMYVDNSFNSNPVYVFFPDTGYGISISAGATQWFPIVTNAYDVVFASEFVPNDAGQTRFIFVNVNIEPIESAAIQTVAPEWLGTSFQNPILSPSDLIASRYRRSPALGDMMKEQLYSLDLSMIVETNFFNVVDFANPINRTFLKELRIDIFTETSLPMPTPIHVVTEFQDTDLGWYQGMANSHALIDSYENKTIMHLVNMDIMSNGRFQITNILAAPDVQMTVHGIFTYHLGDN